MCFHLSEVHRDEYWMRSLRKCKRVPASQEVIARCGVFTSTPMTGRTSFKRGWAVGGDVPYDSNFSARVAVVAFRSFRFYRRASS
ncbi:hypothetical protein AVEN_108747-1 [Araneus ventricosus]|uniref:Uncharacterized protein n=1 Tax=Araneus ventricosus TaxID=182803 RepID=A0A4Y2FE95_ARAVE|nr:hypothetical protein AVEN_108747-1 [Araneus ventricosus]